MEIIEMDKKARALLRKWDPFNQEEKAYKAEIAEVIASLYEIDHPVELGRSIREIYNHSYGMWIPLEDCVQISYKLLAVKYEAKSIF